MAFWCAGVFASVIPFAANIELAGSAKIDRFQQADTADEAHLADGNTKGQSWGVKAKGQLFLITAGGQGTGTGRTKACPPDCNTEDWANLPGILTDNFYGVGEAHFPEVLGEGNFGKTWKATAKDGNTIGCSVDKPYAVKVFTRNAKGGALWGDSRDDVFAKEELMKLRQECDTAQQIQHKLAGSEQREHFARCVYSGVPDLQGEKPAVLFLVLEYGGEDLGSWWSSFVAAEQNVVKRRATFFSIMRQMLSAADGLEKAQIVHHNLKDSNIVVSLGGDEMPLLKLIDFGAAVNIMQISRVPGFASNFTGPLESAGLLESAGTCNPAAPPEWGRCRMYKGSGNKALDHRFPYAFDIYMLGDVLVRLLAGQSVAKLLYDNARTRQNRTQFGFHQSQWCSGQKVPEASCPVYYQMFTSWSYILANAGDKQPLSKEQMQHVIKLGNCGQAYITGRVYAKCFGAFGDGVQGDLAEIIADMMAFKPKYRLKAKALLDKLGKLKAE